MSGRDKMDFEKLIATLEGTSPVDLTSSVSQWIPELDGDAGAVDDLHETLAKAAPDKAPPDDLFERITEQTELPEIPEVVTIPASKGKWEDRGQGVWMKMVTASPDGKSIFLLRCGPGAVIPAHNHTGWEYALVMEGQFQIAGRAVRTGDSQYSVANTFHPEITTDTGCLLLVVA